MDLLKLFVLVIGGAFLLGLVIAAVNPPEPAPATSQVVAVTGSGAFYRLATATRVEYRTLYRYVEHYVGEEVEFRGQILQVITPSEFRVGTAKAYASSSKYYEDVVYVSDYSGTRLLEDDLVTVRGYVRGLITYKTVLGASVTIPWVECVRITRGHW